jgi:hypothetical protein
MLSHCSAFLIARAGESARSLDLVTREIGFGTVTSAARGQSAEAADTPRPLVFFLMDRQLDDTVMSRTLSAVRQNAARRVCYAPVVLFIEDCPFETYLHYVHMGFDDVITIPEKREILVQRLDNQLGEHLYFRTPTYLGPDRRRFDLLTTVSDRRGRGPSDHEEITIMRSALTGIEVVRSQQFISSHPARVA